MSQALSAAVAANDEDNLAGASGNVSLRGTTRGLEILISGTPSAAALGARLTELLAEAPGFFAGSRARVAIDGALPSGALACLEGIATRFEVQIVEIGPVAARRRRPDVPAVLRPDDIPLVQLAEGTGPIAEESAELRGCDPEAADTAADATVRALPAGTSTSDAAPVHAAPAEAAPGHAAPANAAPAEAAPEGAAPANAPPVEAAPEGAAPANATPVEAGPGGAAPIAAAPSSAEPTAAQHDAVANIALAMAAGTGTLPPGPRLVIGPLRSGVIVDHEGHVIVIGDVNPGAEVRATGSIMVLGRLRGVAHAAIGRDAGFIVALSLQPQQLRIGRMVARAGDADHPGDGAEIAYATGETIVVERFLGRLPSGLAASM
jgi:septum formation inhibitor MinC